MKKDDYSLRIRSTVTGLALALGLAAGGLTAGAAGKDDWQALPPTKIGPPITDKIESHLDLIFARYGDRELLLNLYRPKDEEGPLPAIVCIHGGGWNKGDRRHHANIAQALAARGYVTVSIDYRLSGEAIFPAHIHDCKAAVRWLRANAEKWGIDSDNIGAIGHSAGGHLVALLATSGEAVELEGDGGNANFSSSIQAAVPMGAQTHFMSERNRVISSEKEIWQKFLSGSQEEQPETYRLASPLSHLDKNDPPCWFITGEKDDPSTHADEIRRQMEELGIQSKLTIIKDAPHPFTVKQVWFDEMIDVADAHFNQHLKGRE